MLKNTPQDGSLIHLKLHQDALSQVLDKLRLRGTSVMASHLAERGSTLYDALIPCIYVIQSGGVQISLGNTAAPVLVEQGDVVLMVHGAVHRLNSTLPDTTFMRGEFGFDGMLAERFLNLLPDVMVLQRPQDKPYEWVDLCCSFILDEVSHDLAGASAMVSRLLDLLFVRTLRVWLSEVGKDVSYGWLSGAVDARIGKVLKAVHADPAHDWDLSKLASLANLSRSAFATRFLAVVDQTPMTYVNGWRLDQAAELLRYQRRAISDIIAQIGYTSEAAFSRAFRLRYGHSPTQWRKLQHASLK